MSDDRLRQAAIRRIKKKREFRQHLNTYLLVNALLIAIWAVTDAGGYFWPIWPILGWGIGLAFHGYEAYGGSREITAEEIDREIRRMAP